MRKMTMENHAEIADHIKKIFTEPSGEKKYFECACGLICPGEKEAFEILEEIRISKHIILVPGIYRLVSFQTILITHAAGVQKLVDGEWIFHWDVRINIGHHLRGGEIIDWRGIRRVKTH